MDEFLQMETECSSVEHSMYKNHEELTSQQYLDQSEQQALPSNQLKYELASRNTKELFKIKINEIVRNPEDPKLDSKNGLSLSFRHKDIRRHANSLNVQIGQIQVNVTGS